MSNLFDEKHTTRKKDKAFQNMNVNVAATTARATPACAARVDTAPTTSPPAELLPVDVDELLVLVAATGEPDEVPDRREVDRVEDVVPTPFVLEVDGAAADDPTEDDTLAAGAEDVVPALLLPLTRYDGGGTALDGSASAPVPQGIACPLGWTEFGGGTVVPDASAMANRPVHVRFGEAGEVNW